MQSRSKGSWLLMLIGALSSFPVVMLLLGGVAWLCVLSVAWFNALSAAPAPWYFYPGMEASRAVFGALAAQGLIDSGLLGHAQVTLMQLPRVMLFVLVNVTLWGLGTRVVLAALQWALCPWRK